MKQLVRYELVNSELALMGRGYYTMYSIHTITDSKDFIECCDTCQHISLMYCILKLLKPTQRHICKRL